MSRDEQLAALRAVLEKLGKVQEELLKVWSESADRTPIQWVANAHNTLNVVADTLTAMLGRL